MPDVAEAVEEDEVAGLELVARDRRAHAPLRAGVVRQRDADLRVHVHREAGAVEAARRRPAPAVRRAEVAHRDADDPAVAGRAARRPRRRACCRRRRGRRRRRPCRRVCVLTCRASASEPGALGGLDPPDLAADAREHPLPLARAGSRSTGAARPSTRRSASCAVRAFASLARSRFTSRAVRRSPDGASSRPARRRGSRSRSGRGARSGSRRRAGRRAPSCPRPMCRARRRGLRAAFWAVPRFCLARPRWRLFLAWSRLIRSSLTFARLYASIAWLRRESISSICASTPSARACCCST